MKLWGNDGLGVRTIEEKCCSWKRKKTSYDLLHKIEICIFWMVNLVVEAFFKKSMPCSNLKHFTSWELVFPRSLKSPQIYSYETNCSVKKDILHLSLSVKMWMKKQNLFLQYLATRNNLVVGAIGWKSIFPKILYLGNLNSLKEKSWKECVNGRYTGSQCPISFIVTFIRHATHFCTRSGDKIE